jgi:ubiquinone/menaquinone biosynthesis C-methylase UbiE
LKPGGRFVVLDCSKPDNPIMGLGFKIYLEPQCRCSSAFCRGDGDAYRYLKESTEKFLTANELSAELHAAGFRDVHPDDSWAAAWRFTSRRRERRCVQSKRVRVRRGERSRSAAPSATA